MLDDVIFTYIIIMLFLNYYRLNSHKDGLIKTQAEIAYQFYCTAVVPTSVSCTLQFTRV